MPSPRFFGRPLLYLGAWLIVNLVSAAFSPLDPDETYYWMYAGQLDWGYFDHPPAVALLIAIGRDWLPGALGLRLGHVLAGGLTVTAIYALLDRPKGPLLALAAVLVFAQPMLQVYGFIATPDGSLLLFTALYLLAFRNFLDRATAATALTWGLTMAGLLYSKYHGLVLIFFTVLPHFWYLVRLPRAWLAVGTGVALFAPHLYWQYVHDFPSFRYHLSGRDDPYQWKFTWQYVLNQLLIFSPFLVYHYAQAWRTARTTDRFATSLRWLIGGTLLFFLYTTTKGRTEAQWTALLSVPLVVITYRAARSVPARFKGLATFAWVTVGILLLARVLLILPRDWLPVDKPFDHEPWVQRLQERAGDRPVIVENSYRFASLYEFYSGGHPAWTFTDVAYRPNQYDLWHRDSLYHEREVLLLGQGNWTLPDLDTFIVSRGEMRLRKVAGFQVVKDVRMEVEPFGTEGDRLRIYATAPRTVRLNGELPLQLHVIGQAPDASFSYLPLTTGVERLERGVRTVVYEGPNLLLDRQNTGELRIGAGWSYSGMPPLRGQSAMIELPR